MTTKNSLLQCVGLPLFIILYRKVCISQLQNGKPIGLIINKLKHKQNYLNNNQKVPSLFEEAMLGRVYDEPKDDGYNSINEKYRNYKGVYNQLNKKEKSLSMMHPFLAIKILVMRKHYIILF